MGDRRKRIPALLRKIGLKRRLFIGFVIVSLLPMAVLGVICLLYTSTGKLFTVSFSAGIWDFVRILSGGIYQDEAAHTCRQ